MTVTEVPPVTTRKAAGIWTLVMVIRNWWTWEVRHRYYTTYIDGVPVRRGMYGIPIQITEGTVADPGPQEDENMRFHATHAILTALDEDVCHWEVPEIEDPDLGEDWKTYADWWPTTVYIN